MEFVERRLDEASRLRLVTVLVDVLGRDMYYLSVGAVKAY